MESHILNKQRTLRTKGYVLWLDQLPSNVPDDDGQLL